MVVPPLEEDRLTGFKQLVSGGLFTHRNDPTLHDKKSDRRLASICDGLNNNRPVV
jgi:hypothetical protein